MQSDPENNSQDAGQTAPQKAPRKAGAPSSMRAPASVWRLLRPALGAAAPQLATMSLFVNLLSLAIPIFVLQVYDRVVPHNGVETLKAFVLVIAGVVLFDFILKQARSRLVQSVALRVDIAIAGRLFSRLTGLPLRDLEKRSDAEWRALMRDGDAVRDAVAGPTVMMAVDLPFLLLFWAAIAFVAPPVAMLLLVAAPLFIGLAWLAARAVAKSSQAEHDAQVEKTRLVEEAVAGRVTAKSLGLAPQLFSSWTVAQAQESERSVRRGALVDGFSHLSGGLGMATTIGITTVGALAIMDQAMTIGGLIAANMLAARVVQPFGQMVGFARSMQRLRDAVGRLDPVLTAQEERFDTALERRRPKGDIRLTNVTFRYDAEEAPVLERLSVRFRAGAITGIFGSNGSGKSTALKLAMGLYRPDEGKVLLDDADIAQFGREELARWFGYLPQQSRLFPETIRENIARGMAIDDAEVLEAARLAGAGGFIDSLPKGFATEIGDGGRTLSPGQAQRIALARALVTDPAVLVLDEPSAHLDFEAEAALIDRLQELKADRSVVLVSHSRRLLERCDQLIVVSGGRIVLSGPAEEVLPSQGRSMGEGGAKPSLTSSTGGRARRRSR